jgi:hypothetical protein
VSAPTAAILAALRRAPADLGPLALRRYFERELPASAAREACLQLDLRRRVGARLPPGIEWWLSTKGLQQASRWPVAAARALALDQRAPPGLRVWDATCGLGLDALALARRDRLLAASDRALESARAAAFHLEQGAGRAPVLVADALSDSVRAECVYVDPDRRAAGARTLDSAAWSPSWARLERAASAYAGCLYKLPPSFDPAHVHAPVGARGNERWRWTSHASELCEVTWWTGVLAPDGAGGREAHVVQPDGSSVVFASSESANAARVCTPSAARATAWLCEADPALTCSGLLGAYANEHELELAGPGLGFLAAPQRVHTPFVRCWRVLEACSADERTLRALLRRHSIGPVDVKVRGHALGAAELSQRLRGKRGRRGLVAIGRLSEGHAAWLLETTAEDPRSPAAAQPILCPPA